MATGSLSQPAQETLKTLRAQIDAMDRELVALLKKRIGIVSQVGQLKRQDGSLQCFIRSGREADMLRDIYAAFDGSDFNPLAACAIWRLIISASTQHESPMQLIGFKENLPLGHAYFGEFMPSLAVETLPQALQALAEKPNSLLVLPHWQDAPQLWQEYAAKAPQTLHVFAAIPFFGSAPEAFVAANLVPEPSRDDIHLFLDRETGKIEQLDSDHRESSLAKRWLGTYARPIEGTE